MAIRKVYFNVTKDGISPCDYAWGGIQNEDNATEINFVLDLEYLSVLNEGSKQLYYRIDFESAYAGYHPSENIIVESDMVTREVPKAITRFGGEFTCTLVITRMLENGESQQILTAPATLFLTRNNIKSDLLLNNLSAFEEHILTNVKQAVLLRQEIEEKLLNGEFKGEKGDNYTLTTDDKNEITNMVLASFTDVSEVAQ